MSERNDVPRWDYRHRRISAPGVTRRYPAPGHTRERYNLHEASSATGLISRVGRREYDFKVGEFIEVTEEIMGRYSDLTAISHLLLYIAVYYVSISFLKYFCSILAGLPLSTCSTKTCVINKFFLRC